MDFSRVNLPFRLIVLIIFLLPGTISLAQSSGKSSRKSHARSVPEGRGLVVDSTLRAKAPMDSLLFRPDAHTQLRRSSGKDLRLTPEQQFLRQRLRWKTAVKKKSEDQ